MKRVLLLLAVSTGVFAISYAMSDNNFTGYGHSYGVSDSTGEDTVMTPASDSSEADSMDESAESAEMPDSAGTTASASDTITMESGLKYIITRVGKGPVAKVGQVVSVHYSGRLASDGREFDNSFKRQAPIEFPLGRGVVIKGWDKGIAGMAVGEARTLIIPGELGYGKRGNPRAGIPADAVLIFDLELVSIK